MNSYERIYRTLAGEPVDRVPAAPIVMAFAAKFAGHTYGEYQRNHEVLTDSVLRTRERFHFDQVSVISDPYRETADYGAPITFVDDGVCRCDEPLLQDTADINKLGHIAPDTPRMQDRVKAVERFRRELGNDVSVLGWVEGPMAIYSDLRGLEMAMIDTLTEPEFVQDVSSITMENAIAWARAQVEAGADMIGVGDAAASLINEEAYRELVLPWHRLLFAGIRAAGGKVRLHICGNINHLIDAIGEAPPDVLDLDWMVDLPRARNLLGPDITLFGQFDPSAVLLRGTPEGIAAAARRNIAEGGQRFGIMPGCEVPRDTPLENMAAFCPGPGSLLFWD